MSNVIAKSYRDHHHALLRKASNYEP